MAEQHKPETDRVSAPLDADRLNGALESLRAQAVSDRNRRASASKVVTRSAGLRTTALDELRFAMALRGWCDPAASIPTGLDPEQRLALLDAIADESEMSAAPRRQWFLNDAARRRALRSHSPEAVAAALEEVASGDTCTTALRALYTGPVRPLPSYTADELRALASAAELTIGHAPNRIDINDTRRWAARKARESGYRKLLSGGFFGRSQELAQLERFLTAPLKGEMKTSVAWVWGPGGLGKSTLLAAACLRVLEADDSAALVHFDFDRSDLDPTRKYSLDLELLRQLGGVDATVNRRLEVDRERIREQIGDDLSAEYASGKARQSIGLEAADAFSRSIIDGALDWLHDRKAPLLLILDTWEQVQAGGPHYWHSLQSWLIDLALSSGLTELRVVVCGRTEPASLSLPSPGPPLKLMLAELQRQSRLDLLVHREVPPAVAGIVADSFGGNPLLLHLAANSLKEVGEQALLEAARNARDGRYPHVLVEGLLYRRILNHLDPATAAYAHPGLLLPELTREVIRLVLGPLNGEPAMTGQRADEIFEALAGAEWLVERSGDGSGLRQKPDDRRMTLQLINSDPAKAAAIRGVHEAAAGYHRSRKTARDQGLALYHELMLVRDRSDLAAFETRDFTGTIRELRPYIEELPEIAQSYVQERLIRLLGPDEALESLPDAAWRRYLLGEGDEPGYGDTVVTRSDPLIALSLWRRRPVGEPGRPPTFVIQAVAETAEWDDPAVDVDRTVYAIEGAVQDRAALRRVTAVTRLALLRRPGRLSHAHTTLIRHTLERTWRGGENLSELCAIAAVAEAFGSEQLVPRSFLEDRNAFGSETRLYLVHTWRFGRRFDWKPHLDAMVTIQRDWSDRAASLGDWLERGDVDEAENLIDRLHGGPLDAMTRALEKLRKPVRLHTKPDPDNLRAHVMLLRGPTPEFYRPVRQALRESFAREEQIRELMVTVSRALSIRPKDLEPAPFAARAQRDPGSMFLALTTFVDRARAMGYLLDSACRMSEAPKLHHVRDVWYAWDRALGNGMSSSWLPPASE